MRASSLHYCSGAVYTRKKEPVAMDGQTYISPLALLKRFCVNVFCRGDIGGSLDYLSKDIHWYGTADGGDIHSI